MFGGPKPKTGEEVVHTQKDANGRIIGQETLVMGEDGKLHKPGVQVQMVHHREFIPSNPAEVTHVQRHAVVEPTPTVVVHHQVRGPEDMVTKLLRLKAEAAAASQPQGVKHTQKPG